MILQSGTYDVDVNAFNQFEELPRVVERAMLAAVV